MAVIDVNWNPNRKELRMFSALLIVFFAIVGGMVYRKTGSIEIAATVFGIAGVVGAVGVALPNAIRPVYIVWMAAVFPIGWVVSHVLMGAMFYLVFMPVGGLMKLCGKDPMQRELDRDPSTSYWIAREKNEDTKRYFKQY